MLRTPVVGKSSPAAPLSQPTSQARSDTTAIHPLTALRLLRSAGGALFAQVALHGQLAWVEWAEEKRRLGQMLIVTLLGFACLLAAMLLVTLLVLALSWETAYRIPALMALIAVHALGAAVAWRRLQALSALGCRTFAATREELAADIALLKSTL